MTESQGILARFWKGFFWGPPSHKRIAWVGAAAGVAVLALAGVVVGKGYPLFTVALALVGLAEFGWAAELLSSRFAAMVGWARLARWLCAAIGTVLATLCVLGSLSPVIWFGAAVIVTGLLLALEMAPGGPANRPR